MESDTVRSTVIDRYVECVHEAARFLQERLSVSPSIGIVQGTGLSGNADRMEILVRMDYTDIPHFPVSTVESHPGRLIFGVVEGKPVVLMEGRFHLYEGYSPWEVVFPIRVMKAIGVRMLILSNASGGLQSRLRAGDILLIQDHLNLTGSNPLAGPHQESLGDRFPDMSQAYDRGLRQQARLAAARAGVTIIEGIYAGLRGPSLETPAEVRMLRTLGADVVGFSTVMETIAAVQAGMRVLGISVVTNVHDPDCPKPSSLEEIIGVAREASERVGKLIAALWK